MPPTFASSWLAADPAALALLPARFHDPVQRSQVAADCATRRLDPALHAALVASHARLPPCPARQRNLAQLAEPGTITVVTGQQMGLFLGPLYTIFKAATAIAAARALTAETGRPCVPMFWLQTEDHDFAEIDHCVVQSQSGAPVRIALVDAEAGKSRVPVGHRLLGPSVEPALARLAEVLGPQANNRDLLEILRQAYRPEATIAQAFTATLAALFHGTGLICLDPRDPTVARLAAPVHRACIEQAHTIADLMETRARALDDAGWPPQVHIRPGAPLCFFAPDADDGPRYRLDPSGVADTWTLVGHPGSATVTTAELLAALEKTPLRFTSSALSRPIVQDTLLPNAAYVGGPGEVAYFAQLSPLYAHFGLPMPLVVHRARLRILDDRVLGLLDKLGLSADEVAQPRDELLGTLANRATVPDDLPEAFAQHLDSALQPELDRLAARMTALDPNLAKAVARTHETIGDAMAKLLDKYQRALGLRDQVQVERLDRLREMLMPQGEPQERVLGMPGFAARQGAGEFIQFVLDACPPETVWTQAGHLQDLPRARP